MLEWVPTPYGEMVPKVDGSLLASKVDPNKEGKAWVSHHQSQISSSRRHFIFGVGSGHHVLEAAMKYPECEFIGIEAIENLALSQVYVQLRAQTNVEIILGADEKKIIKNERVQKALAGPFSILTHQASYRPSQKFYEGVRTILTARDWKSFNQVLKFRPEDDAFLNEINFVPKSDRAVSAVEIVNLVKSRGGELSDNEFIWLALGELIK